MTMKRNLLNLALACLILPEAWASEPQQQSTKPASLWTEPGDLAARDLFFGQGGRRDAPDREGFVFVKEDLDGNSPEFVVKDRHGVHWKVKLGAEARPETVVTRFVWAVGYYTDEDYFVPSQMVEKMPQRLKRGAEFVSSDGVVRDARWERMDHTKLGQWKWTHNAFSNTRQLNGLRVLMALFNNYDMKDAQNSIYDQPARRQFLVGDLGATLGPTGSRWPGGSIRGDMERYRKARFVKKVTKDYVDFAAPSWPMMFGIIPMPPLPYHVFTVPFAALGLPSAPDLIGQRWIGKRVPREDVVWMGRMLSRLSPEQPDYSPAEVKGFSEAVQARIAQLNALTAGNLRAGVSPGR
jgi:hypothetical protein